MTTPTARRSRREVARVAQAAGIAAAAAARDEVDVLGSGRGGGAGAASPSTGPAPSGPRSPSCEPWRRGRTVTGSPTLSSGSAPVTRWRWSRTSRHTPRRPARLTHEAGVLGTEGILRLAGEGAFAVREFAVTDLAVTLAMSEKAARHYVAADRRAARPAPAVVGTGDGGAVAGVEGPPGRRADHPAEGRHRWLRRRPARRVRPPALPDPDQQVRGGGDHPLSARPRRAPRRGRGRGPRGLGRGRHHRRHHPDRGSGRLTGCPRLRPGTRRHRHRPRRTRRRIVAAGAQGQGCRGARRPAVRDRPGHRRHH